MANAEFDNQRQGVPPPFNPVATPPTYSEIFEREALAARAMVDDLRSGDTRRESLALRRLFDDPEIYTRSGNELLRAIQVRFSTYDSKTALGVIKSLVESGSPAAADTVQRLVSVPSFWPEAGPALKEYFASLPPNTAGAKFASLISLMEREARLNGIYSDYLFVQSLKDANQENLETSARRSPLSITVRNDDYKPNFIRQIERSQDIAEELSKLKKGESPSSDARQFLLIAGPHVQYPELQTITRALMKNPSQVGDQILGALLVNSWTSERVRIELSETLKSPKQISAFAERLKLSGSSDPEVAQYSADLKFASEKWPRSALRYDAGVLRSAVETERNPGGSTAPLLLVVGAASDYNGALLYTRGELNPFLDAGYRFKIAEVGNEADLARTYKEVAALGGARGHIYSAHGVKNGMELTGSTRFSPPKDKNYLSVSDLKFSNSETRSSLQIGGFIILSACDTGAGLDQPPSKGYAANEAQYFRTLFPHAGERQIWAPNGTTASSKISVGPDGTVQQVRYYLMDKDSRPVSNPIPFFRVDASLGREKSKQVVTDAARTEHDHSPGVSIRRS